jgi:hypothetical protein
MIKYWIITSFLTLAFYILVGRQIRLSEVLTAFLYGWFIVPLCVFIFVFTQILDILVTRMMRRK